MSSPNPTPVLRVRDLVVRYGGRDSVPAVADVTLSIDAGETLGLVGESGSGKSTLGLAALSLLPAGAASSGSIELCGRSLTSLKGSRLRRARQVGSMVFQSSSASLDLRRTVGWSIAEPLLVRGVPKVARHERVNALLHAVGLDASMTVRYPHELSGGQKQRVGIARALAADPALLVCDEPTSALDVSVQAQIVNLLLDLQDEHMFAMLFISHDIAVVEAVAHRIAVLRDGRVVEEGVADHVLRRASDSYTRELLAAVPRLLGERGST